MLSLIKGGLIVSCQALEDEPLFSSFIMGRMALAAKEGGAKAIRAQGINDIKEIKKVTNMPIIGLIKKLYSDSDIYITATMKEVKELVHSKCCEMIALDLTHRKRPNGENVKDLIKYIHDNNILVMADISTYEEGIDAERLGVDCVSTTLSGYTSYSRKEKGPDLDLVKRLSNDLKIPVIAEGRIHSPEDLKRAYKCGAYSAVVGGAITRPKEITERFVEEIMS
ncbi:N-acetylmannosamine-6-phosphate 2-epimerase [Clostridium sp.]|uniref:N-acetylmannosamine-6-phosphate 2-epimerase n=1 Tax=Clostridium sp. TaxID=1506 RepID=UPI003992996B